MPTETCGRLIARGGWSEDLALRRCHWPIGPRNTYSNVAYWIAGIAAYLIHPGQIGAAFLAAMLVLGAGSMLYHGLKTVWANNLDWLGMYWVLAILLFHQFTGDIVLFAPMTVMAGITAYAFSHLVQARFDAVMGLAAVGISAMNVMVGNSLLAALGIMVFILAYAFWNADKSGVGLWGHGLWHILSAAALLCSFLSRHP